MSIYSDINQNKTEDGPVQVINLDSIFQSIKNIISTNRGERLFLPGFGADLDSFLFEPIDEITALQIFKALLTAIEEWDPRVILDYGLSNVDAVPDDNKYKVRLIYRVKSLSSNKFEFIGELGR